MDISTLDQGVYNVYLGYVGGNTPFKVQIVDESGQTTDVGTVTNTSGNVIDCFENFTWKTTQKVKLRFTATGSGEKISVVYASVYKKENAPTDNDRTISDYYFSAGGSNSLGYLTYSQYGDSHALTAFNATSRGLEYNPIRINAYCLGNSSTLIYNGNFLTAKVKSETAIYLPTGKYKLKILASNDSSYRQTSTYGTYGKFKFLCYEMKKGSYTKLTGEGTKINTIDFANEANYISYASDTARLYDIGTFEIKNGNNNLIAIQTVPMTDNTKLLFFGSVIEPINEEDLIKGDINDDKVFDTKDTLCFAKYLAQCDVRINALNTDVNDDGKCNLIDLLFIKKRLAGIIQW